MSAPLYAQNSIASLDAQERARLCSGHLQSRIDWLTFPLQICRIIHESFLDVAINLLLVMNPICVTLIAPQAKPCQVKPTYGKT
jgi:hypothetical protein